MDEDTKEFIVAKDYDQLVTLFYSDLYFKALELVGDEEVAKGLAKKVFEVAERKFDEEHNNFVFVESILNNITTYTKKDESKMAELSSNEIEDDS